MTLFQDERELRPARSRSRTRGRGILLTALTAALVVVGGYAFQNSVRIADQVAVWGYRPTALIAEYAARSTMTTEGEFVFYASTPAVEERSPFNAACGEVGDHGATLGCYLPLNRSIHLFRITDERLDGMQVVTAAHEMLHAVWHRLGSAERTDLAALLRAEEERLAGDPVLAARMALYPDVTGDGRASELHSILGTEFAGLSPGLEAHYARYLADRASVITLHDASESVFTTLRTQSATLVSELEALRAGIEADSTAYTAGWDALNADIETFNDRWSTAPGTEQQFSAERDALEARQDGLDALFESIQERRAEFEATAAALEAMNVEVDDLNATIDSRSTTAG